MATQTEEQKHYEHTKNFFYWAIGISGTLIAIIASVSLYFTYNNMNDYKKDLKDALSESKSDIKEMVTNANTTLQETKEQSYLLGKEIKSEAERNIGYIRDVTKSIALTEAEQKVNEAFKEKNIQKVIDETAKREIESRVKEIVSKQLEESSILMKVLLSVDRITNGDKRAFIFVDSVARFSKDNFQKSQADSIIKMKLKDWDNYSPTITSIKQLQQSNCGYGEVPDKISVDSTEISLKKRFDMAKSAIQKSSDLYCISYEFEVLRFLTNQSIRMFDFDAVKKLQYIEGVHHPK